MGQQKAANKYARARVPYIRNFRGCCKKPKKSRIFGKRVQKLTKKEKEIRASLEKQLKDCGADLLHYQELLDDYIFSSAWRGKCRPQLKNKA